MPSGPSRFDDGDDPATSRPGDPAMQDPAGPSPRSDPADPAAPRTDASPPNRPNYLIRRAIVVGGVVAVLATASIVIGQLMGSGGDDTASGAVPADWDSVVLLDERTGRVTIRRDDGDEVGRIESGVASPTGSRVVEDSMLVVSADRVAMIDLARADDDPVTAPSTAPAGAAPSTAEPSAPPSTTAAPTTVEENGASEDAETDGATTTFGFGADGVITPTGSALTMIAPRADAGRAVLVHGPSGDTIDTDSFAPVAGARYEFADSRAAPSGRDVLVTDSGNFASVLFSFDRDEPSFFAGLALAVDDNVVVTAQNVGNDATVNVFDHAGALLSTGRTPAVRAGMVTGDDVVLITVDGAVVTMAIGSGDTSDGARLDIGTVTSGHVTTSGDRLVVSGADGTALVDADADAIGTYAGVRLADDDVPPTGSQCITLVPRVADPEPELTVVDSTDADAIVDSVDAGIAAEGSERLPLEFDASGCVVAVPTRSGYQLLTVEGVEQIATGDVLVALAPDASRVVVERGGRLFLVDPFADVEPTAPIDIGRAGGVVHFTRS